ncbi:MAG: RNA methyltransferase [Clostridia bacterium]|nr:RNA methyltransferase [Clostridia bacterium]
MDRISSAKNPMIRDLRALGQRKAREAQGRFLVEGEVMIAEALGCGLTIRDAIAVEAHQGFIESLAARGARACLVPESIMASVCDTRSPQGVCASFDLPSPQPLTAAPERIVALDGVQDPGNVGTIWRTADAAGLQALLLGEGCADPFSPKVQRAAMGSGFRVPCIQAGSLPEALAALKRRGWRVIASDLRGADFYAHPDPGSRFALVIGSEARGISEAVRAEADMRLKLPMRGGAESLNAAVAAGIMMYELMRG